MDAGIKHAAEFRRCLEKLDVAGIRRLHKHVSPHLPQPASDNDALIALHHARTQTQSIAFKLRAYSHAWLLERGYPSGLPDALRPRAQRQYPIKVSAVGISVSARNPLLREAAALTQQSMSDVVMESYAKGETDPAIIKPRLEAERSRMQRLFGDLIQAAARKAS